MESVEDKLQKLAAVKVLVVGDVMLDRYWMGDVVRISPEAPVPVVSVTEIQERLGGAGNVAGNITSLNGRATLIGIVGGDEAGERISQLSRESGIAGEFQIAEKLKTTVKLRVISRNQQLLRADFEQQPESGLLNKILERFENDLGSHEIVVLSDYGKGGLANIDRMISMARKAQTPVLIDPKGKDFSRYCGATMITPNLDEFESVSGKVKDDDDLAEKAMALIKELRLDSLLVTLSDRGMTLFELGRPPVHISARSREVYDVSGAGDTVIGVMAMSIAAQLENSEGMKIANSAAGVVISKLGTAAISRDELARAIKRDYPS